MYLLRLIVFAVVEEMRAMHPVTNCHDANCRDANCRNAVSVGGLVP
jgi:hypothetical protein